MPQLQVGNTSWITSGPTTRCSLLHPWVEKWITLSLIQEALIHSDFMVKITTVWVAYFPFRGSLHDSLNSTYMTLKMKLTIDSQQLGT